MSFILLILMYALHVLHLPSVFDKSSRLSSPPLICLMLSLSINCELIMKISHEMVKTFSSSNPSRNCNLLSESLSAGSRVVICPSAPCRPSGRFFRHPSICPFPISPSSSSAGHSLCACHGKRYRGSPRAAPSGHGGSSMVQHRPRGRYRNGTGTSVLRQDDTNSRDKRGGRHLCPAHSRRNSPVSPQPKAGPEAQMRATEFLCRY